MRYVHGKLTCEQIRTTYFVIPDLCVEMALGRQFFTEFRSKRTGARARGGELMLIGWPDGTTLAYERADPSKPFDVEDLAAFYKATHRIEQGSTTKGAA